MLKIYLTCRGMIQAWVSSSRLTLFISLYRYRPVKSLAWSLSKEDGVWLLTWHWSKLDVLFGKVTVFTCGSLLRLACQLGSLSKFAREVDVQLQHVRSQGRVDGWNMYYLPRFDMLYGVTRHRTLGTVPELSHSAWKPIWKPYLQIAWRLMTSWWLKP